MPYNLNIREEELKNKVSNDWFWLYDCSRIIGNVDFCVAMHEDKASLFEQESLLWAEAKKGISDSYKSLVQLIITIGKARTFDKYLPPAFLGAIDAEKIAFIPYSDIHDIFYQNDFNWNVTPSNHETKEFMLVLEKVKATIDKKALLFYYDRDERDLKRFIKSNFIVGKASYIKTRIDKNNFMVIYNKWLLEVKPSIQVNWDIAKKNGLIDGDFYLADLLSRENETLKEKLFVLLHNDKYELDKKIDEQGLFSSKTATFNDDQKAHNQFWNKYERPPKEEYWDYIVNRRDLLVPQDVRERKGSFFTPQIWVELSQKYLADVLGENWQDEFYVWDCAAGTGNLLHGLTNKYNIWASTLDQQDVEVMHDRIRNGANLLDDHVFQFDFLNDEFTKLPKPLLDIINNPEKRKRLVIYINPPYAEAGNIKQKSGTGSNKAYAAINNKIYLKYKEKIGKASNEIFTHFLIRIYFEIPTSIIANFSKLKNLQSSNFFEFRNVFLAKLEKLFLVQANTFDNVKGHFPIGFFIWKTEDVKIFDQIYADVYDKLGNVIGHKSVFNYDNSIGRINNWIANCSKNLTQKTIGTLHSNSNDFQHQNDVFIDNEPIKKTFGGLHVSITSENLLEVSILFSVRHVIEATWLNDRDQFLYPNDGWKKDNEFQCDCLTYTLFNNNIQSKYGTNHWIPFTEYEVVSHEKFESNFMTDFFRGKFEQKNIVQDLFNSIPERSSPFEFSVHALEVFDSGRKLWKYYNAIPGCNVNASLYDIREHFQGRNNKGIMNSKSDDMIYMKLISLLRERLKDLARKIEPKVYEYGFLMK